MTDSKGNSKVSPKKDCVHCLIMFSLCGPPAWSLYGLQGCTSKAEHRAAYQGSPVGVAPPTCCSQCPAPQPGNIFPCPSFHLKEQKILILLQSLQLNKQANKLTCSIQAFTSSYQLHCIFTVGSRRFHSPVHSVRCLLASCSDRAKGSCRSKAGNSDHHTKAGPLVGGPGKQFLFVSTSFHP